MIQLTCKMCGSTDLIKQDGIFACQTCGCKYSIEDARKMMVESTVKVEGTVKIDDSSKIKNYYTMAENAYDAGNKKEAESYCNKIIEIDPNNYRAWLLKGRAAGWQSTLANNRIDESVSCFTKAVDNAPSDDKDRVRKEVSQEIENLSIALMTMCCNNFAKFASQDNAVSILNNLKLIQLYGLKCDVSPYGFNKKIATRINNAAMNAWNNNIYSDYIGSDGHPSKYAWERYIQQGTCVLALLQTAIDLCDDDNAANVVKYKNSIAIQTRLINSWSYRYGEAGWVKEYTLPDDVKRKLTDEIMEWHSKIKEIDPNYEIPSRPVPQSSGCYVATAVYGSYDCPQVWTLRRYRDYTLAETWYGRAFIRTYYAISPTLVKWFGHTKWFKKMWEGTLNRIVANLNADGVEDTPYEDKVW